MDIIGAVYDVVSAIATKVKEVRELPDECRTLCDIVTKLQPIISSLSVQLGTSERRQIMEMLLKSLSDADEVVDYITKHPRLTAIRSGKYKQQLMDAMQQIDNWILRIQPLTNAETYQRLQVLKEDVSGFLTALDTKIDRVLDNVNNLPNEVVRQLIPELNSLLRQNVKNPLYQSFIVGNDGI